HLLLVAVTLLATLGLTAMRRFRGLVVALCAILGFWLSDRYVRRETTAPEFALNHLAGQYLDPTVQPPEGVAVLGRPILLEGYLLSASKRGERGYQAAIKILNQLENTPPNYQRLLVSSRLGKQRLHSYAGLKAETPDGVRLVVQPRPLDQNLVWVVV